jgi:hypothetical protein
MREEIAAYAAAVRSDEWHRMRDGNESAVAWAHVTDMFRVLQTFEPKTPSENSFYDAAVGKLDDLVSARRQRLSSASEGLPGTFQILLVVGAVILIMFFYLVRAPGLRTQVLIVTAVATMISFNLLVALVLEYPFSGQVAVSSSPFSQGALAEVTGGAPPGK